MKNELYELAERIASLSETDRNELSEHIRFNYSNNIYLLDLNIFKNKLEELENSERNDTEYTQGIIDDIKFFFSI